MLRALVLLVVCCGLIGACVGQHGNWSLVKLVDAAGRGAVCLDGSPGAYYIKKPLSGAMDKWIIFHEGGGWCNGDGNCYDRSLTDLGSSTKYNPQPGATEGDFLFDNAPFLDHVIVYAKYCDGGSWTGLNWTTVMAPTPQGPKQIYYRGRLLLDELFLQLGSVGLNHADTVVYSGCSAGALTTYVHLDYIHDKLVAANPSTTVVGLADAMFSLQWHTWQGGSNYYTGQFTWGYQAWNSSISINQKCKAHYGEANNAAWVCFHGAISAQFIDTPMLVVNSKRDTWQARGVLGLNGTDCPGTIHADGSVTYCTTANANAVAEGKQWAIYGDMFVEAMSLVPAKHGCFLTNCPQHCMTGSPENQPSTPNMTLHDVIVEWYPLAVRNGRDPGFVAPRHIASSTDGCYEVHGTDGDGDGDSLLHFEFPESV